MLTVANAEAYRVFELVGAYEDRQITLDELKETLQPVSSEMLQVMATFGSARDASLPSIARVQNARRVARALAAATRCRN